MTNRQNSNNELYYTVLRFDMKYFFVTARNLSDRARARVGVRNLIVSTTKQSRAINNCAAARDKCDG